MSLQTITIKREPEIQFDGQCAKKLKEVEKWILSKGGKETKTVVEDSPYFDTENNRLIREGMECRLKQKGGIYRTDLKTPIDTGMRSVEPDHMGVIWRNEIMGEAVSEGLVLSEFSGLSVLRPVKKRVSNIFEKPLHLKFRAQLKKRKFERTVTAGKASGLIEYAIQRGHMTTPDGSRKSDELYIVEIELKKGCEKVLAKAIDEFRAAFSDLNTLKDRKVMVGFKLIEPDMSEKARFKFAKLQCRLTRQSAPALEVA